MALGQVPQVVSGAAADIASGGTAQSSQRNGMLGRLWRRWRRQPTSARPAPVAPRPAEHAVRTEALEAQQVRGACSCRWRGPIRRSEDEVERDQARHQQKVRCQYEGRLRVV